MLSQKFHCAEHRRAVEAVELIPVSVISIEMLNERLPVVELFDAERARDDLFRIDLMIANEVRLELGFVFNLEPAEIALVVLAFAARHPRK